MPKRLIVVYDLSRYLFKDYATFIITIILLLTGWRTLNTLEILSLYLQRYRLLAPLFRRLTPPTFLEHSLKDVSLQKKLAKEFKHLMLDATLLGLLMLDLALLYRARSVLGRLWAVQ
jgi:hypothetical protein